MQYPSERIGIQALRRSQVRLLVFDPDREEIVAWID